MPDYGQKMMRRVEQFYVAAFFILTVFSVMLALKQNPLFFILALFSTGFVIFYSMLYRYRPKFRTVG